MHVHAQVRQSVSLWNAYVKPNLHFFNAFAMRALRPDGRGRRTWGSVPNLSAPHHSRSASRRRAPRRHPAHGDRGSRPHRQGQAHHRADGSPICRPRETRPPLFGATLEPGTSAPQNRVDGLLTFRHAVSGCFGGVSPGIGEKRTGLADEPQAPPLQEIRTIGLEPTRCYSLEPETSASTNSATCASECCGEI